MKRKENKDMHIYTKNSNIFMGIENSMFKICTYMCVFSCIWANVLLDQQF